MGITTGRHRRTAALAVTAALTAGGLALGVTSGAADSSAAGRNVPGTVVVQENEHGRVLTADTAVRDKRALLDAAEEQRRERRDAAEEPAPDPGGDGDGGHGDQSGFPVRDQRLVSGRSERITVAGGEGAVAASGDSFVKVPFMEYYAIFTDTSSSVAWLGKRPFNADSVQHTDTWNIGSVGAPFWVVGAPEGAEVRSTGSTAEARWTTTVQDNWYSEHAYDQVAFYPPSQEDYSNVYRISHSVTGTFQFGSSFYTVTARDRAYS
ncbi:hypothetical protein [Streptomyces pseudogriseolus]|uniref:hypothetical protein n=1 Tax=Streptomyces pseudogriseolus TaxID=36817 RepID=UPI003FA22BEF